MEGFVFCGFISYIHSFGKNRNERHGRKKECCKLGCSDLLEYDKE